MIFAAKSFWTRRKIELLNNFFGSSYRIQEDFQKKAFEVLKIGGGYLKNNENVV